jgi:transposase
MSEKTLNFEQKEFRSVIKYLFVKGLSGKEIFADMVKTLDEQCPSYATIKNWVAEFKRGRSDLKDEHRSGRPISVTTPGDIDSVHDMILENRRIGLTRTAEILHISYERVFHIVHHDLGMSKLAAKWVPKCLNADQKRVRLTMSEKICHRFEEDSSNFLDLFVTMDETWVQRLKSNRKSRSMRVLHVPRSSVLKSRLEKLWLQFSGTNSVRFLGTELLREHIIASC